jgi:CRISPR-associated endonuclease Cas2
MRPRNREFDLAARLKLLREAGLTETPPAEPDPDPLASLAERVKAILGIVNDEPVKATDMTYLIMYDISSNKVRNLVAKYLKRQGCIRIQKSVFLARSESKNFRAIVETLAEVNSFYANEDSILLAPVNTADLRAMQVIGKDLQIDILQNPPNTLFF